MPRLDNHAADLALDLGVENAMQAIRDGDPDLARHLLAAAATTAEGIAGEGRLPPPYCEPM